MKQQKQTAQEIEQFRLRNNAWLEFAKPRPEEAEYDMTKCHAKEPVTETETRRK